METSKIEILLKAAGGVAVVSFCVSYAAILGLLVRFGIFFEQVPISLADVSQLSLAAMPIVTLLWVAHFAVSYYMPEISKISEVKGNIPEATKAKLNIGRGIAIGLIGVYFIVHQALNSTGIFSALVSFAGLICGALMITLFEKYGRYNTVLILSIPIVIISAASLGEGRAEKIINSNPDTEILFADGTKKSVTIISNIEDGVFYYSDGRPRFRKWDDVAGLSYISPPKRVSILCYWKDNLKPLQVGSCEKSS